MTAPSPPLKCPKCGSVSVRRSRKTTLDRMLMGFGFRVLRCRECRNRFRTRCEKSSSNQAKTTSKRAESTQRRRAARRRDFFVYSCALVAFVFMLYAITRERG